MCNIVWWKRARWSGMFWLTKRDGVMWQGKNLNGGKVISQFGSFKIDNFTGCERTPLESELSWGKLPKCASLIAAM